MSKLNFDPNQLSQKGIEYLNQGNFIESKKIFEKLLSSFPKNLDLINLLGFVNLQLKFFNEAVKIYSESLALNPNQVEALFNRAIANKNLKNLPDALNDYEKITDLAPNLIDSYINKSAIYEDMNKFSEAISEINKAIDLDKENFKLFQNRGNLFQAIFNYELANKDFKKVLELSPNNIEGLQSYANNLGYLNSNDDEVINAYKIALKLDPNNSLSLKNYASHLLYLKKFDEGWINFEKGWNSDENKFIPDFAKEIPMLKSLSKDKKILIWGDQGIGDQIIYSSLLNDLPLKNKITIALDDRLIKIYENSFSHLKFKGFKEISNSKESFDAQMPLFFLCKIYRNSLEAFKKQKPFLNINVNRQNEFKVKFENEKKKVCGLSWKSKNPKIGYAKSIDLIDLADLFKIKDIVFFDLQYNSDTQEIEKFQHKINNSLRQIDNLDKFNDIEGLLAFIQTIDFVITTSNVTAHLAGSIGKKTYLLIPYGLGNIWYWHNESKSLWYPSIKIFKQDKPHDWSGALRKVIRDIS